MKERELTIVSDVLGNYTVIENGKTVAHDLTKDELLKFMVECEY